jgi:hypothetical protein
MSSERFSAVEKNAVICSHGGLCCSSSWVKQPAADSNGCLAHFFKFEAAGSGRPLYRRVPTILYLCFFVFLKPVLPQKNQEGGCKEIQV